MTVKEIFTCDVCGEERKEANHWFVIIDARKEDGVIALHRFEDAKYISGAEHLCGQACVQKRIDAYLVAM